MRAFMGSPGPVINLSKTDWVTRALGLFQNIYTGRCYARARDLPRRRRRLLLLHRSGRPTRIVKNSPNIINQTGPNTTPYRRHSRNITRRIPVFAATAVRYGDDLPLTLSLYSSHSSLTLFLSFSPPPALYHSSLYNLNSHARSPRRRRRCCCI